MELWLNAGA